MTWEHGTRMMLILGDVGAKYSKRTYYDIDRGPGQSTGHIGEYDTYYLFLHGNHSVMVHKNDANVGVLVRAYVKGYEEFEKAWRRWRDEYQTAQMVQAGANEFFADA